VTRRSPTTFVSKTTFACSGVKASVTPADPDAGVVNQHIDLAGLRQHFLDARFDRCVVANVQFHGHDAELPQGLGGLSVLALRTAHRGVHNVASAEQCFCRVKAKAAASAGDQDCFGHTLKDFHTVLLPCCDTSLRGLSLS
jgi:hypothetical protein